MSSRELRVLISLWRRRDRARSVTFHTHELPVQRGSRICVSQSKASSSSLRVAQICVSYRCIPRSSSRLASHESQTGFRSQCFLKQNQTQYFNHGVLRLRGVQRGAYEPGASRDADRIGGETSNESSRLDWLEFCWKRRRFAVSADRHSSDTER